MKLHALAASAVALTLVSTPVSAGNDNINKDLIALMSISAAVFANCGDLDVNYPGMVKWSDQNGADLDTYSPAVVAAIGAIMENDYDRSKLIPEVTRLVRKNLSELLTIMNTKGKKAFCKQFMPAMLNTGFLVPKSKDKPASSKGDGSF